MTGYSLHLVHRDSCHLLTLSPSDAISIHRTGYHRTGNQATGSPKIARHDTQNVYATSMEFPFSIYVYHVLRKLTDKPFWQEELRANNQQMAIYAAGLLYQAGVPHQDTVR